MTDLTPERIARIIEHMNTDHPSSIADYCRAFGDEPETTDARIVALDRSGFEVVAQTPKGPVAVSLRFPEEPADATAVRDALIAMAVSAKQVLGEDPPATEH